MGGSLEIFLEPQLPPPRVIIVGSAPIAKALEQLSGSAGYAVIRGAAEDLHPRASDAAVIVAAHGGAEERVLAEALAAGVPYVALVASAARGAAVREALEVPQELRAQLHTPAGLNIGARTPAEIAISILAQLIADHRHHPGRGVPAGSGAPAPAVASALDPVCGMAVAVTNATAYLDAGNQRLYFCGGHCRDAYAAQHVEHGAAG